MDGETKFPVKRFRPSFVRPSTGDQSKNRLFKGGFPNFGRDYWKGSMLND